MTKDRSADDATITVHVPLSFSKRGGRKVIISEFDAPPPAPEPNSAIVKALARAYRWRRQIESGEYASITELAKSQRVNQSYACRLLRMTLLAPQIVEAALNGSLEAAVGLKVLAKPLPLSWPEQINALGI